MTVLTGLQVTSALSYVIAVLVPALDAVFPVLPSETAIIALGVATAGSTDPRIGLLVACSALGAFLGDNLSYLLGRRFGPWAERRFFPGEKGARRRAWAERSLQRYGLPLIVVCRFVPGGRTAVTLSCGIIGYPRRRFVVATAVAGSVWAVYLFCLGRLGGTAFEDRPWVGLAVAFGVTVAVSGLVEVIRRIGRSRAHIPWPARRRSVRMCRRWSRDEGRSVSSAQEPVITKRISVTTFRYKQAPSERRKRRLTASPGDPGTAAGP
jgi:membrane-associated protein